MKQFKNLTLAIVAGLLVLSVATVSCKKKSGSSTSGSTPTISAINPSSDTIGQVLQIVGTNFTGATVTVGGIAATNVTIAATVINATVPAGVTFGSAVQVKVTTPAGSATFNIAVVDPNALFHTADGKNSSNQVQTSAIIGHWTFDGTTSVVDGAGNSNAPVLSSPTAVTYVAGKIGQAGHFNNSWLTYPANATAAGIVTHTSVDNTTTPPTVVTSSDTLKGGFTVSLWAQVPDTSLLTTLFALYSPNIPNWPLLGIDYRRAGGQYEFDGGIGNINGAGPFISYASFYYVPFKDSLTWAFIAITFDTTSHSFNYYANNIKIKTWTSSDLAGANASLVDSAFSIIAPNYATIGTNEGIGRTPNDNTNALAGYMSDGITGNIDDIRFFNTTLSATDLDDLYQLGNHGQ